MHFGKKFHAAARKETNRSKSSYAIRNAEIFSLIGDLLDNGVTYDEMRDAVESLDRWLTTMVVARAQPADWVPAREDFRMKIREVEALIAERS